MGCSLAKERFNPRRAARAQETLRGMIDLTDPPGKPRIVAGLDAAYTRVDGRHIGLGVAVALDIETMKLVSCSVYASEVCVPYIPGLLAFREMRIMAPPLSKVIDEVAVDIVIVDGHGIAHPRGFGIASHIGVAFRIPSIGVAKKRLHGELKSIGNHTYLVDGEKIIGAYLAGVYVSPGHMITLETAVNLVRGLRRRSKLPEPTRIADRLTKQLKRRVSRLGFGECGAEARGASLLNYI